MKKIWYALEDWVGALKVLGYMSYGLCIWDAISHTFPWSWTFNDLKGDSYTFMLGCFLLELSKKIIQENELPARSTPPKTIDADTTPEYTPTVDNSLEEYIVADYLINHHSENHANHGTTDGHETDTTPAYTNIANDSLKEYIMADYLLNHHSEELDDFGSPDDYDDYDDTDY